MIFIASRVQRNTPVRLTSSTDRQASTLARVFRLDVSVRRDCGGRMRVIAAQTEPASIRSWQAAGHALADHSTSST